VVKHLLIMLVAGLLLASCGGGNVLDHGKVTGKTYDDPDTWWISTCASYRPNGSCQIYIPMQEHDGPHWYLKIHGFDTKEKEHTETHEVTEATYNELHVGDDWRL
jgi:hypothetical protein